MIRPNICIDCGLSITRKAIRCKKCSHSHIWLFSRQRSNPKSCIDCGKLLKDYRSTRCLSCSRKFQLAHNPTKREYPPDYRKADKNPNWKGGRLKNSQGYIEIYKPQHPRANIHSYVKEHILVWEEVNKKILPVGWIIHHLNGIKDDNRPQNLIALPNRRHSLIFAAKAKRIQELEALLKNQRQLI